MPHQPGEICRIRWPYEVAIEKDPYAIIVSEAKFNDKSVVVVPLSTADLRESSTRVTLPDEILGRRSVAHADKLTRVDLANLIALERDQDPIDEELLFDVHLAIGETMGAHFFPGEFETTWKPPGSKQPERGSIWQAIWHDSKTAVRPGLIMSDWHGADDHVILMPVLGESPDWDRRLPFCVGLDGRVARADQLEVVRTHQLREYEDRVDRRTFESACRAIAHVIGAEL